MNVTDAKSPLVVLKVGCRPGNGFFADKVAFPQPTNDKPLPVLIEWGNGEVHQYRPFPMHDIARMLIARNLNRRTLREHFYCEAPVARHRAGEYQLPEAIPVTNEAASYMACPARWNRALPPGFRELPNGGAKAAPGMG